MDLKKATITELLAEKAKLNEIAAKARAEAKTIAAELEDRLTIVEFERLPEAQKNAILKHIIGPAGIPSAEKIGTIGGKK